MVRGCVLMTLVVVCLTAALSEARYLPTRADDTRLDEIRELLRELLERANEGNAVRAGGYEKRFMFKRSVSGSDGAADLTAAQYEPVPYGLSTRLNLRA